MSGDKAVAAGHGAVSDGAGPLPPSTWFVLGLYIQYILLWVLQMPRNLNIYLGKSQALHSLPGALQLSQDIPQSLWRCPRSAMGVESAGAAPGRGFAGAFPNCGWKIQVPVDLWICQGSDDVQNHPKMGPLEFGGV